MTRVQLRLTGSAEQIFTQLVDEMQCSPKDVVLDALALLHYAAEQVQQGRKVGSYDTDAREFTALTTPSLQSIASRAREAAPRVEEKAGS
ncbi:MAG: hypothetical protein Q8L86_11775 [Vicinamibacterales bacterium]|nr:hypothetical protein [Vicinamibacterales bacterium]